jgi:ABC-type antimicrobial peptide transport system permease subunit
MFYSYIKIAWRNLFRDRQFTLLNLIGLTTGLTCVLLIYLWVSNERNMDKFHENDSRLFQVIRNVPLPDGIQTQEATPGLLAKSLKEELPEVEEAAVINPSRSGGQGILSFEGSHIKATELYVSPNFFTVFSFQLIEGDKQQALVEKHSVVLSDQLAMKLFNTTDNVIGKTIAWDRGRVSGSYIVSGICRKASSQSSLQFDILFAYETLFEKNKESYSNWGNSNPLTYVVLKKGTVPERFNQKIRDFSRSKYLNLYGADSEIKYTGTLFLQKFSDKYLHNRYENGVLAGGRIEYVRLFSLIAIFILIIACINFMNLSTAKASRRMKEVGIKKVSGATRGELMLQYIGESLMMAFLAMTIAISLVVLILPLFNNLTGKELELKPTLSFMLQLLAITGLTGLIAGSYPAFYLSGFNPATVLKGKLKTSLGELWIRKGLVILQFSVSTVFIISVLVVYKQMKYIQSRKLGYNKDNIISFKREGELRKNISVFLSEVKKVPGVVNAASFGHNLTGDYSGTNSLQWEGQLPGQEIEFANLAMDYGLMDMLELEMKEGRKYSKDPGSDTAKIIFNEAAISAMGIKDPVGKTIILWGKERQIIGVVKNFHFESLYEKVKPCFLQCIPGGRNILVKIKAGEEQPVLARLEKLYKASNLGLAFEYSFLDDDYQRMYTSEQLVSVLSRYFAGLAIVISCLGLLGLAVFTAQKRQKEIGIRKVVGASAGNIAIMLSKDYLKLVVVAILIAFPLSWWLMNTWLVSFQFRIDIGPGIFLIAGMSVVLITLFTIGFQAIRAAVANPVKALKTE